MSRIGRMPIAIPAGVEVKIDGSVVTVKGAKATLTREFHPNMTIAVEGNEILVTRPNDDKHNRALHGLTRSLVHNMVVGVTEGFKKELSVQGVGYRVAKQGKDLVMNLGYSHQVTMSEVEGITIDVPNPNTIIISGPDKQKVGQFAAEVREKRPPDPIRARAFATLMSMSAARKARPALRRSKERRGENKWFRRRIPTRRAFSATSAYALRSAAPLSVPVWTYSVLQRTSMHRLLTM